MSTNTGLAPLNTNELAVDTKVNDGKIISSPALILDTIADISRADEHDVVNKIGKLYNSLNFSSTSFVYLLSPQSLLLSKQSKTYFFLNQLLSSY